AGCFFFHAEDGMRAFHVTGVQTCALPIFRRHSGRRPAVEGLCRRAGGTDRHAGLVAASLWQSLWTPAWRQATCAALPAAQPESKIGRAACRERVWIAEVDRRDEHN